MASTNFIVHLTSLVAMLVLFWVIIEQRAQNNLLKWLLGVNSKKKLLDPYATLTKIFDNLDIGYESEIKSEDLVLIDLCLLGSFFSQIEVKHANFMRAGQKTLVVLTGRRKQNEVDETEMKKIFKSSTGLDIELNLN